MEKLNILSSSVVCPPDANVAKYVFGTVIKSELGCVVGINSDGVIRKYYFRSGVLFTSDGVIVQFPDDASARTFEANLRMDSKKAFVVEFDESGPISEHEVALLV